MSYRAQRYQGLTYDNVLLDGVRVGASVCGKETDRFMSISFRAETGNFTSHVYCTDADALERLAAIILSAAADLRASVEGASA